MQCILHGAKITDTNSPFHNSIADIRIVNGKITDISKHLDAGENEKVFDFSGKYISPGWIDMLASFGDPGNEQKEDITTGIQAALQGGFTSVCLLPNTEPALHSKAEIEYVIHKSRNQAVTIYPLGSVTKKREGKDLTEMYDMRTAGAVAFTDADYAIRDAGILLRSLQYVKPFQGTIINIPNDHAIAGNAFVNEGKMSIGLGMYGNPDVLEEIMVIRDIKLAEYTGSKIHIGIISSKKSIPHIAAAKEKGIQVTAGVSAYQLYFDEEILEGYDTNYKVNPPLRNTEDKNALADALKNGIIDVICSYHLPHETDAKQVEFEYASEGMAGIEAAFGAANAAVNGKITTEQLVEKFAINPRNILGIPVPSIQKNATAEFTVFDPDTDWIFTENDIRSRSKNNGFIGKKLKGKAVAVINNDRVILL